MEDKTKLFIIGERRKEKEKKDKDGRFCWFFSKGKKKRKLFW